MSKIEVDTVVPQSGTTITIGESGDTVALGSGATQTGFGLSNWSESSGNLLPSNSTYGIYLGVNSATASNLLDDYEEGTFTATLRGDTEPGTLVTTTGLYTKVGRQVTVQIDFDGVNTTGYGGDIYIYGLPFPNTSTSRAMLNISTFLGASFDSGATYCVGEVGGNNTVVTFQTIRSNNSWTPAHHTGSSEAYYWVTGTYQRT